MKISALTPLAALAALVLAACEEESRPRERTRTSAAPTGNQFGAQATPGTATDFVTDAAPSPTPDPTVQDTAPTPTPSPAPSSDTAGGTGAAPTTAAERNLPYGTPVAGKPGFVTSPHAPYAGYVDVRGFPPNTEVKDPYSGKIFLVP